MKRSSRCAGFTLTEILIVLSILGLLSAVLLPVLSSSRSQGRRTVCASNLRQIGQAMALYVGDYNGSYPPAWRGEIVNAVVAGGNAGFGWKECIATYMNNGFPVCPDVQLTEREQFYRPSVSSTSGYAYSYWLSIFVNTSRSPHLAGRRESAVRFPSQTITVPDARAFMHAMWEPDVATSQEALTAGRHQGFDVDILSHQPGALRHGGGANYLFADGHVKWLRPEQISTARKSDGTTPGFGL